MHLADNRTVGEIVMKEGDIMENQDKAKNKVSKASKTTSCKCSWASHRTCRTFDGTICNKVCCDALAKGNLPKGKVITVIDESSNSSTSETDMGISPKVEAMTIIDESSNASTNEND